MPRSAAARREPEHHAGGALPSGPVHRSARQGRSPVELDRVIHERVRLAIVSALAGAESLRFTDLKDLLGITDGNLSVHARRLEDAGFVTCEKSFVGRVPLTEYRLTTEGRRALAAYLDHMESLIRRVREG